MKYLFPFLLYCLCSVSDEIVLFFHENRVMFTSEDGVSQQPRESADTHHGLTFTLETPFLPIGPQSLDNGW